jgi:glycosyltransferase involved in cell wall biosynthesis
VKRADIADDHVVALAGRWRARPFAEPGVVAALVAEGIPSKLALAKVTHLVGPRPAGLRSFARLRLAQMNITVLIPTIPPRRAEFDRAIASVQAQTLPPAMVWCEIDKDRTGAAATRNRLLKQVRTEYVAFLDDDDEFLPDHLKLCARYMSLSGVDVVYPGYEVAGGEDPVNCFGLPFDAGLLRRRNFIPVTTLCRTELVRDAGGFQELTDEHGDPCEDWGLWLSMLDNGATFGHLPQRTWRWHLGMCIWG